MKIMKRVYYSFVFIVYLELIYLGYVLHDEDQLTLKPSTYEQEVVDFDASSYQTEMDELESSDALIIPDQQTAKEVAFSVWNAIYGESIYDETPFQVYYDKNHEYWLVSGTLPMYETGETTKLIIDATTGELITYSQDE